MVDSTLTRKNDSNSLKNTLSEDNKSLCRVHTEDFLKQHILEEHT